MSRFEFAADRPYNYSVTSILANQPVVSESGLEIQVPRECIFKEGGCTEDAKTRCLKAAQVFYQMPPIRGNTKISMTTKTYIIKAVVIPTLFTE